MARDRAKPKQLTGGDAAPPPAVPVAVASMTGFAVVSGGAPAEGGEDAGRTDVAGARFQWEARAVNGRSLDLKIRLPAGLERLEPEVRARVGASLSRGSVSISLAVERSASAVRYRLNAAQLGLYLDLLGELQRDHGLAAPSADAVLAMKGVLEPVDEAGEDEGAFDAALLSALDELVRRLVAMRREEGVRLADAIGRHLDEIERLVAAIAEISRRTPEALQARILRQLQDLSAAVPPLPPDRLAQEVALVAAKADITEELDRLLAHVAAARDLLAEGGAIGRRLDFLAQEFNREANTVCSKAGDADVTRGGLALKARIEQMREQIQNIE